ncbi:hypothetical protein WMR74_003464 [Providencia rettgeri]
MREIKPTQKDVPSSDVKDLFFNSGLLDIWATSLERKYIDRFGNCHLTAAGMEWLFKELVEKFKVDMNIAIVAAGYITIDSFQQGADLPNNELTQRNHILRDETTGEYYRWDGDLPKQVPAGSTPQSTGGIGKGAWVGVGDASLRSDISINNNVKNFTRTYDNIHEAISVAAYAPLDSIIQTKCHTNFGDNGGAKYFLVKNPPRWFEHVDHKINDELYLMLDRTNNIYLESCGANEQTDSSDNVQNAILAAAWAGVNIECYSTVRIDKTVKFPAGTTFIGKATDLLDDRSPSIGTKFRGIANPMFDVCQPQELDGYPSVVEQGSACYGFFGFSARSDAPDNVFHTFMSLGKVGKGVRNITVCNFEARGFSTVLDFVNCYTQFVYNFSVRDRNVRSGTVAFNVRSSDGITSGYIRGGAIYQYDWGLDINSVAFGFSFGDIDFDKCNHMFKTNGYIESPALFYNLASEYTHISDIEFNHSGTVGGFGVTTGVGVSSDHRIINKGSGKTYLRNMSLNTSLVTENKRVIYQSGTGSIYLDDSVNPNDVAWSAESTGRIIINGAVISKFNGISYDYYNKIGIFGYIAHNIRLTGEKKIILKSSSQFASGVVTFMNFLDGVSVSISASKTTQGDSSGIRFSRCTPAGNEKISVVNESIVIDYSASPQNTVVSISIPSNFTISTQ